MEDSLEQLTNDGEVHHLLAEPQPAYTNTTVYRALIVWLHCGQRNNFKQVCDYFHYLEDLENDMPPEKRINSCMQEFSLFYKQPPTSHYLTTHFPDLYSKNNCNLENMKQINEIKLEGCVFDLAGFCELKIDKDVTSNDKDKTSQMILVYCKVHSKSVRKLLMEFEIFAKKTDCDKTFNNITGFVKNKFTQDELQLYRNIPKDFDFLHDNFEDAYKRAKVRSADIRSKAVSKFRGNFILELKKEKINNLYKIRKLKREVMTSEILNLFRH